MSIEAAPWTGFVPVVSPETAPFWNAANEGTFLLQRCQDCSKVQYHYRALCSHCMSDRVEDFASSGRGKVWTYTVVYKNGSPAYKDKTPYVIALVELEGGVKVLSNIETDEPESVTFDTPVDLIFAEAENGQAIPLFKLAER
jgi:uncharacterized protein